jgi:predicted nuclease of predicted toxin-antitoxin system
MRLAVDVHISRRTCDALIDSGHVIVTRARDRERDEDFFTRAVADGAEGIVTADKDFAEMTQRANVYWIRVAGHVSPPTQAALALLRLEAIARRKAAQIARHEARRDTTAATRADGAELPPFARRS